MSVCGHLILVAIMVTSFVVMMDRARLVAPDRIQIIEIDLNDVRVSGDETRLYNVGTPDIAEPTPESAAPTQKPETPPVAEPEPIVEPTLVEPVVEPEQKPEEKKPEPEKPVKSEPDTKPAPKKKTVVRVNRAVMSLDRTLTVSVVDALRVAMTRCWTIDTARPDIEDIRAVAHLTMRKNGTVRDVWFESAARAENDPAFAYVLETIRSAIDTCQPFRMLPEKEFSKWQKIQLTFYPTQGKVL